VPQVEIYVQGKLDERWVDWLEGFSLTHTEGGETILTSEVQDQAALYGLIAKLRDLGVKLISIHYSESDNLPR
jgi:hypothetical protein